MASIAVTGGKLTTYRSMAAEVVDVAEQRLGRAVTRSSTDTRPLPGERTPTPDIDVRARLVEDLPYTMNDVTVAVNEEFACTIADVLVRRTHLAFETRDHGMSVAPRVAEVLAPLLAWSDGDKAGALAAYRAEVARLFAIEP